MPSTERRGRVERPSGAVGVRHRASAVAPGSERWGRHGTHPLTSAHLLHLQRVAGNQAVLTALADNPRCRAAPHAVQRLLERGSFTGWGALRWADDKAKQLWADLDRKFNTELPALDKELVSLLTANPRAAELIGNARGDIAKTIAVNDGVIHRNRADALNTVLDDVIARVKETQNDVAAARRQALEELLPHRLQALGQLGVFDSDLASRRKEMLKGLPPLKGNDQGIFDRSTWFKKLRQLEKDFRAAREKQAATQLAKQRAEAERRLQDSLDKSERDRRTKVLNDIKTRLANPSVALRHCGGDVDLLRPLVERMRPGEDTALETCLRTTSAPDVEALLKVHGTSVTDARALLVAWAGGAVRELITLVRAVGPGKEAALAALIRATAVHEHGDVLALLAQVDVATLNRLVAQGSVAQLKDLFVTKRVDVGETTTLLNSSSGGNTVLLLSKLPDAGLINRLRALEPDAARLRILVSDLPHAAGAVQEVRALFTNNAGATLAQVLGLARVQQARGLRNNAGALIGEVAVTALMGGEQAAVDAGLAAIDSGKPPHLTHPNGAKFGDTFDNDQGRLPGVPGAAGYKEYYIEKDTHSLTYHGERRLVVSNRTGHVYYTADHYATFRRVR